MPLIKGAKPGSKGFSDNVRAEKNAGKSTAQSVAIAYSESGESKSKSKRVSAQKGKKK